MGRVELNDRCEDQYGVKCAYWITGESRSWSYPCECREDSGYCYCHYPEYPGHHDDWVDRLYLGCPFREVVDGGDSVK